MTDYSPLANSLSEPLRQPFWWAALASITLHGTLGASAPTISNIIYGGNSSKKGPGSVGLIELTPAEMGRLPQTVPPRPTNSRFAIAPVPLQPSRKLAPPLPPEPSVFNLPAMPLGMPPPGLFPFPPSPSPSLPTPSPQKTPSQTPQTPPQKQQTIPQTPPPPPSSPLDNPPPLPLPSPPPSSELPRFPLGGQQLDDRETLRDMIARSRVGGLSNPEDVSTPDYPGYTNPEAKGVINLPGKNSNKNNQTTATGLGIGNSQPFGGGNNGNPGWGQPGSNLSGQETSNLALKTYVDLFNFFQPSHPELIPVKEIVSVNVPYPKAACSQQLEGRAEFGAVVSQGLIVANPGMITSTNHRILDEAAKTGINESLRFPVANQPKLYPLVVEFKYDPKICSPDPTLAPAPVPAPTPKPDPKPAPAPVPAPTPKPDPKPAPAPVPAPTPKPSSEPAPAPAPTPESSSEPAPAPASAPEPSSEPAPAPAPTPEPSSEPAPAPAPTPEPSSEPAPAPT
jgi:hypothetical protein